jgi:hypothetical protein
MKRQFLGELIVFNRAPCYMGIPNQFWCESSFAFNNFEKMFKNKVPFFVSTYKFLDKETPVVDNLFFDIDSYFSIRIPYKNIKNLRDYFRDRDVPTIINFSGGKGFHLYAIFKEEIPKTDTEKNLLKDLMYSIQMRVAEDCGAEAFDEPTFARLHMLCRYPTSKYIRADEETGKLETNGFYCRYLTDDEFDAGLKKISKLTQDPGIVPRKPRAKMTMQEFADTFKDFKLRHREENNGDLKLIIERQGENVPSVASIGVPCLKEIAVKSDPTHFERMELVAFLKHLGYTDLSINAFIKHLGWRDYKYSVTSYQIRHINSRLPKCSFLRKTYGEQCKKCTLFGGK